MIRIAHFSDLHYGTKTLAEADRCFGAAIDRTIELGAEVAVISGDSTDHALDLHAPAVLRLAAQLRQLADHCPVLMLQGTYSHEPPGTLGVFRLLGGRHPLHVADRIEQVALTGEGCWATSSAWCLERVPEGSRAVFSCLPTVNKAVVAAAVGAVEAAQAVGENLAALLRGFAPVHRSAHQVGVPTIVVSHGTVFGCLSEHGVPMAGFDHEFTTGALFSAEARAVMLGHIHKHQEWCNEGSSGPQRIAYPGSIGRFHHGEEGEKGFLMWWVGAQEVRCAFESTPARRTIDIVFEGRPDMSVLRAAASQPELAGASVRVRWTVADEDRHEVDHAAIRGLLAIAADIKLEGRIVPVVRTRAAGIAQLANLSDKVRLWAQTTECKPEPLLFCLDRVTSQSPDTIAAGILHADSITAARTRPALDEDMASTIAAMPS